MCFVAFYYYWIYILSLTVLWHLFSKVLHQIFGPDFERNISNRIRQQRTINRLIKFGVAFNSSSREHFERTDPKTFKKYNFVTNKLIACVGTSLCYFVNFIPRMFDEDKSNPITIVLFIFWLFLFSVLTPVCFLSFIFWLLYWTFKLVKQKYYKDRRPLRIKNSFHYFLTPKICQAVEKKTTTHLVHFPHGIEYVLTREVVRVHSFTRHILELLLWVVVKRPYYFSLKSLGYILQVYRSSASKTMKILTRAIRVFEVISFLFIIGLPKSVLEISYRTSMAFQLPLIYLDKTSDFINPLKPDHYHHTIYTNLIRLDFSENEERPLRGLRVPISSSHHLPPLDYGPTLKLNLHLLEDQNEKFRFI